MPGRRSFDIEGFVGTHYDGTAPEKRALDAFIKLARATSLLDARLHRSLGERGLTTAQLAVLEALLHLGPLTQTELGRKMLRSGGSVTSVVDNLQKKGWVRRERCEEDRRVLYVHLTAEGRRLIRKVFPGHVADVREAFGALSAAELTRLAELCKKLGRSLSEG